jgi:hypothetical protein
MTSIDWTDVSTGLCESVASYFESTFTSKGVTVWLRFAHEMNYYADSGTYPGGSKSTKALLTIESYYVITCIHD